MHTNSQLSFLGEGDVASKHKVEIYSASCAFFDETIEAVKREVNSSCEIIVHDLGDTRIAQRARELGVQCAPAVVIDGKLASCCRDNGVDIEMLKCDLGDGCER
jgi:hypothetical protein